MAKKKRRKMRSGLYQCRHCLIVLKYYSDKERIKVYCADTGKDVYLMLISKYGKKK